MKIGRRGFLGGAIGSLFGAVAAKPATKPKHKIDPYRAHESLSHAFGLDPASVSYRPEQLGIALSGTDSDGYITVLLG